MAIVEVFNETKEAQFFQSRLRGELLGNQIELHRFDVIGVYTPLLDLLDTGLSIHQAYDLWQPNPYWDTLRNGGSDCFGLAAVLQQDFAALGIKTNILPFNTRGLAPEAAEITGDVGHVALYTEDDTGITIFDPGFALGQPLQIACGEPETIYISGDGRRYTLKVDFENRVGEIRIEAEYHPEKNFGFRLESIDPILLGKYQKQFMRIRETVNCDKFDDEGTKYIGLKIKLMDDALVVWRNGVKKRVPFGEWDQYPYKDELANGLGFSAITLDYQVRRVIRRAPQLRQLWPKSMQQKYYVNLSEKIQWHTSGYRSWTQLREMGYLGGGVAAFIVNESGQILMYRVPESREKPLLSRYAGQYNVMIETAEGSEDGLSNLARGIKEEMGLDPNKLKMLKDKYAEASYGPDGAHVARCYFLQGNGIETDQLAFNNQYEGGFWQWVNPNEILGREIEPNLRPILDHIVQGGLL